MPPVRWPSGWDRDPIPNTVRSGIGASCCQTRTRARPGRTKMGKFFILSGRGRMHVASPTHRSLNELATRAKASSRARRGAGALQAVATVLATMPAAVPVIWLGTKGTVWRSRGASTACRPPVSPGCPPVLAPNEANLLATQPVRRTSYDTGLYPTGGRHRNTAESFAPYRERVFEGLANTLGIAVGSSAAYDGDGKARGHDGPALTGLLLTAFQLSFNPGHVAGKTGGVGLPGWSNGRNSRSSRSRKNGCN